MQRGTIFTKIAQLATVEDTIININPGLNIEHISNTYHEININNICLNNTDIKINVNNICTNNTDIMSYFSIKDFKCPITLDTIDLPIKTPHGHYFEAEAIIRAVAEHERCPLTRGTLWLKDLKLDEDAYYFLLKHRDPKNLNNNFYRLCKEAEKKIKQLKANVKKPIDEELPASSGRVIGRWAIYNLFINEIVAACLAFGRIEENPASIFSSLILCDFILGLIGSLRNRRSEPMFTSLASGVINSTLHTYTPLPVAVNPIISSVSGAVGSVLSYSVYSFWRRNNPEESYQAQSQGENTINTLYGTFEQSNQP